MPKSIARGGHSIYALLPRGQDAPELEDFARRILGPLDAYPQLLERLEVWLDEECSIQTLDTG